MTKTVIGFLLKLILRLVIAVVLLVTIVLIAFNFPVETKNENMEVGISFAHIQARALELDWKQTYLAMLDELRPKRIRLGAYWTEIELQQGMYDFSDLDWLLDEARKRDTEVILAFGIKAPRWPECFIPEFYKTDKPMREEALLAYEKVLIERYASYQNITMWQVENEPFLAFGDCLDGAIDGPLMDREIAQTRELDPSRQIMSTDGGEFGDWYRAAKRVDVFGSTLYRIIHKEPIGYFKYPLGPSYFRLKAWVTRQLTDPDKRIIISELQAEPWGTAWLPHMSIEEQYVSMDPEKFRQIIEYTKKTNFPEAYLWGVEWWYWLKTEKGHPEMWEEAKKVITQRN